MFKKCPVIRILSLESVRTKSSSKEKKSYLCVKLLNPEIHIVFSPYDCNKT